MNLYRGGGRFALQSRSSSRDLGSSYSWLSPGSEQQHYCLQWLQRLQPHCKNEWVDESAPADRMRDKEVDHGAFGY